MKYLLSFFIVCLGSSYLHAQVFPVDTLMMNGPINERVNLVFVGDGYRLSELADFIKDAEAMSDALFAQSPFKEYQSYFNVFAISVPSNETGAALSPSKPIDNYFGSTFGYSGIDRLLVPTKSNKVSSVLAYSFPSYDQVFMVVNSTKYGGSGGWIATSSVHSSAGEIAIHEMGHSFADLRDEYWAGAQYALEKANMTRDNNPKTVRWKNWMGIDNVGIYLHSSPDERWYRPHQSCKMQFLGVDFCAVCKEAITEKVLTLTDPIISYSPKANVPWTVQDTLRFTVQLLKPEPNTLNLSWTLDGAPLAQGASMTLEKADLSPDTNEVQVLVFDETPFSKKDDAVSYRQLTITWQVVQAGATEIMPPKVEEQLVSIYPNPTSEQIRIEGVEASAIARVVDLTGKEVLAPSVNRLIDVSGLSSGTYMLQIVGCCGVLQYPFVKE